MKSAIDTLIDKIEQNHRIEQNNKTAEELANDWLVYNLELFNSRPKNWFSTEVMINYYKFSLIIIKLNFYNFNMRLKRDSFYLSKNPKSIK